MPFLKNVWYAAAHAHELDFGDSGDQPGGAMFSRTICNEPVVMFRTAAGEIAALEDRCPHRFVPLSMGKRIGDTLQCGYHGLSFDPTGACSDAPNDGPEQRARICVRSFVAVERYAIVWLWFGAPEAADPALIPAFEFMTSGERVIA